MLKRKMIQAIGCLGFAMMALSNTVTAAVESPIKKTIDMSAPENAKFSNVLKPYDSQNLVPPTIDELTKQVGKKDELTLFIPSGTLEYFYYFGLNYPTAIEYREKFFYGVLNDEKDKKKKSMPSLGLIDAEFVKKIDFYNNGLMLTVNVKDSPLTEITTEEDNFAVKYTYSFGYILKATLVTKTQEVAYSINAIDIKPINYVLGEYVKAVKNKGYQNKNLIGGLMGDRVFEKDNIVIEVDKDAKEANSIGLYSTTANMTIYDKEVYDNYDAIQDDIKTKSYEIEFKKLNKILN